MIYLYVFLKAGLLSVLYLYGIRRGLGGLDSLEAVAKARAEIHPKASAGETATNHPAPTDAANLHNPPASPPANPSPPPGPRPGTSHWEIDQHRLLLHVCWCMEPLLSGTMNI